MSLNHPSGSDPQGSTGKMSGLAPAKAGANATAAISTEVVQLYLTTFGRGPTRVRTYVQPEFCVCVLGDILTPAERSLTEVGGTAEVESGREKINEGLDVELTTIVERQTGRRVLSHMARVKVPVAVAVHFFLFDDGSVQPDVVHH